jgi:hypothetical protein
MYVDDHMTIEFILDVPDDLVDFVAQNTDRPKPRRYNSTAVTYIERGGVAWLTPPEAKLYDFMKDAGWLFIPQPSFIRGDTTRIPDFLIYWGEKHDRAVLVEIDSDAFHPVASR